MWWDGHVVEGVGMGDRKGIRVVNEYRERVFEVQSIPEGIPEGIPKGILCTFLT